MPAQVQPASTAPTRKYPFVVMGDSHSMNYTLGLIPSEFYAHQVQRALQGYQWAPVVAGSTATAIKVAPGHGAFFPAGSTVQFVPPGAKTISGADIPWGGPAFLIDTVVGDTLTFKAALPAAPPAGYLAVGRGGGAPIFARNYGISGNTTAQMLGRLLSATMLDVPFIFMLYGGTNDFNASSITAVNTTIPPSVTQFSVANATPIVAGTFITVGVNTGCRVLSVSGTTVTLQTALPAAPSSGDAVKIDTSANIVAIVAQIVQAGCSRILIGRQHYLNFATGGDTTTTQQATASLTRQAQDNAIATLLGNYGANVVKAVDFFAFDKARIQANTDVAGGVSTLVASTSTPTASNFTVTAGDGAKLSIGQIIALNQQEAVVVDVSGDNISVSPPLLTVPTTGTAVTQSWHTQDGSAANFHRNAYGERVLAMAAVSAIRSMSAWMTSLAA